MENWSGVAARHPEGICFGQRPVGIRFEIGLEHSLPGRKTEPQFRVGQSDRLSAGVTVERADAVLARSAGVNSFDYLTELQRHARELAATPAAWMPWNYREDAPGSWSMMKSFLAEKDRLRRWWMHDLKCPENRVRENPKSDNVFGHARNRRKWFRSWRPRSYQIQFFSSCCSSPNGGIESTLRFIITTSSLTILLMTFCHPMLSQTAAQPQYPPPGK